jgi:hypothetical protein
MRSSGSPSESEKSDTTKEILLFGHQKIYLCVRMHSIGNGGLGRHVIHDMPKEIVVCAIELGFEAGKDFSLGVEYFWNDDDIKVGDVCAACIQRFST